jgi:hypothetical protein
MKTDYPRAIHPPRSLSFLILLFAAIALLAAGCSGAPQATPTPQVVTIQQTVQVEVTRIVEVVNTVEVTRQVLATVIVEVPVTPEATPTATRPPTQAGPTVSYLPTSTPLPQSFDNPKTAGISRLKLDNETDETLTVKISGPQNLTVELPPNKSAFLNVPFGEYTLRVYNGNDRLYTVRVNIVNADKYEVNLGEGKATVIAP